MAIVIRKNGKANNALEGLERGLSNGIGFGLAAARTRDYREENRRRAMQIDQQIQQERQDQLERESAASAAGGELATPSDPQTTNEQKMARLKPIAERLAAKYGPQAARTFLEDARERDTQAAKSQDLDKIRDEQAREVSEGVWKMPQEEGSLLNPEELADGQATLDTGLEQINAMLSDPNADPVEIRHARAKLKANLTTSRGKSDARKQTLEEYRSGVAEVGADGQAGNPKQRERLNTLVRAYEMHPEIYDDPKASAAFDKEYNDAKEGYTTIQGQRIRIEDADVFEKNARELERLKIELQKAQIKTEGEKAGYYADRGDAALMPKPAKDTAEADKAKKRDDALGWSKLAAETMDPKKAAEYQRRADALAAEAGMTDQPQAGPASGPAPALNAQRILPPTATEDDAKKAIDQAKAAGASEVQIRELVKKLALELGGG